VRRSARRPDYDATLPKHYCGVFGIFGHPRPAELTYYGLYALQHRGQERLRMSPAGRGVQQAHGMAWCRRCLLAMSSSLKGTWRWGTPATRPPALHIRKRPTARGQQRQGADGDRPQRQPDNAGLAARRTEAGLIFQTPSTARLSYLLAQPENNLSRPCAGSKAPTPWSS